MDPALLGASLAALPTLGALLVVGGIRRHQKRARVRKAMQAIDVPGSRRDLALILAMGGDPQKHRIEPVLKPWKGLRLVDDDGKPFRSMTEKQLRSPVMRAKFKEAQRRTGLVIEGT